MMKLNWFLKIILLLIIAIMTLGNRCIISNGNANNSTQQPSNGRAIFEFEYDYMTGYNVFANGETYARNAFLSCNTDLSIAYDDSIAPAVNIPWGISTMLVYMMNHCTLWPGVDSMDFVLNAYLLGMPIATSKPTGNNIDAFAVTYKVRDTITNEIFMFSSIFVQEINNYGGNVQAMKEKTVIHELGHSRSRMNLTHSCEWNGSTYVESALHNDPACVMGMGRINQCNSTDLTVNPHFCPADCDYLKNVTW